MTAPNIATTTTPPAAILSKKFFNEGETPDPAASATSGMTIDAVRAAAEIPATAFSLKEDRTARILPLEMGAVAMGLRDLKEGNGLKKASLESGLRVAWVNGKAIERAEVEAIDGMNWEVGGMEDFVENCWEDENWGIRGFLGKGRGPVKKKRRELGIVGELEILILV